MTDEIYLDNITAAKPSTKILNAMLDASKQQWANLASPHDRGQRQMPFLRNHLSKLYSLLGISEEDTLVLTSGAAESINHVIQSSYHDITRQTGKNHYVTCKIGEAPSIITTSFLEQLGCTSTMAEVNADGCVTEETILEAVSPRTALVSIPYVNALTGVVQPIEDIAELCQTRGIRLHVDITHALGQVFLELADIPIDYITFNGSQLHTPPGVGTLIMKKGKELSPFIHGEPEQDGRRAGAWNLPGLAALSTAVEEVIDHQDLVCTEIARLKHRFEQEVTKQIPNAHVLYSDSERVPTITAIAFPGITSDALLFHLNELKVYAGLGGGNFQQIGMMLSASKIEAKYADSALVFSFSRDTSDLDIDETIKRLNLATKKLYSLSKLLIEAK